MGQHAGIRGRSCGFRTTAETWEAYLGHLATLSAIEISKLPGMPSAAVFGKKRRNDPEFRARADAVMAARRLLNGGRKRITSDKWYAFLTALPQNNNIGKLCERPDMPSMAAVYSRRRKDAGFRASLDAVLHDVRRERRHRIASALRLAQFQKAPAFVEKMRAALAEWRACHPEYHGRMLAGAAEWRARQPKKPRAPRRKWRTPQITLVTAPMPEPGMIFAADLLRNELFAAASAAVPRHLDRVARDDIAAELVLAVLEGEIAVGHLAAKAPDFVRRYSRMYGQRDQVSLHDPEGSSAPRSSDEIASSIAAKDWHDGEINDARRAFDAVLGFQPPTQIDDVWRGQVRRRRAELADEGLSFDEVAETLAER